MEDEVIEPGDNEEFEVEVIDDTPEQDKGRKPLEKPVDDPTEEEIESYSGKVQSRIKELTHARHDERRAKETIQREKQELERAARALYEENKRLKQYVNTGEQQYVETAKAAASSELEIAKRAYKEAYEAGDADALVSAQEALTEAKLKVEAAKNFRVTPVQEEESPVKQSTTEVSPPAVDEATQRWLAKNQWFGDPKHRAVTSFALGLHQELVESGVDPRSTTYFEQIDARLRDKFPEVFEGASPKPTAGTKRPVSVVAPGTRSAGPKKIQLTASAIATAKRLGITPQQYAIEVAKLERANG